MPAAVFCARPEAKEQAPLHTCYFCLHLPGICSCQADGNCRRAQQQKQPSLRLGTQVQPILLGGAKSRGGGAS